MAGANVAEDSFDAQVLRSDVPVVVSFRAAWCVPSQQLASVLDEMSTRFDRRVRVVGHEVDDPRTSKTCRRYRISRVPVTAVFREGRVRDLIGGMASQENIADMVARQLGPVYDVDDFDFDDEVLNAPVPVLVHVDAAWCDASQRLAPVVEETAKRYQGRAKVVRLEYGPATARARARFGFRRVPTFALFNAGRLEDQILGPMEGGTKEGAVRASCVGLTSADNLAEMIEPFVI